MGSSKTASAFRTCTKASFRVSGLLILFAVFGTQVFGQTPEAEVRGALTADKPVRAELKGGEAHNYSLLLEAGDYFEAVAEQMGIDVVVTLFDPSNSKLTEVDSPNGVEGPENLGWIVQATGKYGLVVRSLDVTVPAGEYELKISEPRKATETDRQRLAAKSAYQEGLLLASAQTPESTLAAIAKYREASRLFRSIGDREREARTLFDIGSLFWNLERKDAALESFGLALEIFGEIGDTDGKALALHSIGEVYFDFDDKKKALEYYGKALPLIRELGYLDAEALTLNSMGRAYELLGENQKALGLYEDSLKISTTIGDTSHQAVVFNNIGVVYMNLGDSEKAIGFYEKALQLGGPVTGTYDEAAALNNLGTAYEHLGKSSKALEFHLRALSRFKTIGDPYAVAASLNNIGRVYQKTGENVKALEFYEQAIPILRSFGERNFESALLNNIGMIYFELGDYDKALDFLSRSSFVDRSIGNRRGIAQAYANLMKVWHAKKNPAMAVFFGKRSVNLFQELRLAIQGLDENLQKSYLRTVETAYRTLAEILVEEGRLVEAGQVLALLKEQEYSRYIRRDAEEIRKLSAQADLRPDEREALQEYEKIADRLAEYGKRLAELESQKSSQGEEFAGGEEYADLKSKLDTANAAFRIFLRETLVAEVGRDVKRDIDVDRALQSKLARWGNGTVALYTIAGEGRYRVILTTPKSQIDGKTEIKISDLNKKIFEFRAALQNPAVDPRPLGKELYDILLKPVETDLRSAEAKTLLLSLDGTLRYIPFAALSPDGVHYLAEQYRTVILTSANRQGLSAGVEPSWEVLGLGVTKKSTVKEPFGSESISFSALPGVGLELQAIVRSAEAETGVVPGRRVLDEEFDLAALENGMSERSGTRPKYNVIHLATHFRLSSDMADSFLLLGGNQVLTLEAVSDDSELDFGEVELVTLSACNTAFGTVSGGRPGAAVQNGDMPDGGNGSEVDSLATFIELRGAKAVLATLWPVVDESTSLLMREFYRQKNEFPGITKAEAMQRAQLEMINGKLKPSGRASGCRGEIEDFGGSEKKAFKCDANQPFAHPYFWSPFILIGNWR